MYKKFRTAVLILVLVLGMLSPSCAKGDEADIIDSGIDSDMSENSSEAASVSITYSYPENPAEELGAALENWIKETNTTGIAVSEVRQAFTDGEERKEIGIDFPENGNSCVIFFSIRALSYDLDYSFEGHDNPSFTMAFKDKDKPSDMVTLLALVVRCLAPDLAIEEVKQIAAAQNDTISEDGHSLPRDIPGYQIRALYTDTDVFAKTDAFDSYFGVEVTALGQIWGGIDLSGAQELANVFDFDVLNRGSRSSGNANNQLVFADFTVNNVWEHQEEIHGDTWETIEVESVTGHTYTLRYDTFWGMLYKFGAGQRYTIYIIANAYHGPTIVYAEQLLPTILNVSD